MRTTSIGLLVDKTWKRIETILKRKGFNTILIDNDRALRKFIYDTIPDNCIVGLGNSLCYSTLKIRDILLEKGNKVFYCWNGESYNRSLDTFEEHPKPEFFLTMADSITSEGKLVNHEFSGKAALAKDFPNNIIAFSGVDNIFDRPLRKSITSDTVIFDSNTQNTKITVAVIPFLKAS